jgi:ATP-dependent DNA helicase DinG
MDGEVNIGIASNQAEEWYPLFGSLLSRAQGNWELWTAFTVEDPEDSPPMARWLTLAESGALFDIEVNASPILAAEMLRRNLWNVAYGCLVTSATLTAGHLRPLPHARRAAEKAVTAVVPSPFHHADAGVLRVPDLKADPRDAPAHTAAIIRDLPGWWKVRAAPWCCSRRASRCRTCSTASTATGASKCLSRATCPSRKP